MKTEQFQKQASRRVFDGRVFSVDVDRVILPHGASVNMEVVRHAPSVVLIPVERDGRIVLVRQYRYAVNRWLWELPAGSTDHGESLEAAAVRECAEETRLRPEGVEQIRTYYPTPGFCDERMVFFKLTELRDPRPGDPGIHFDPDEHLEIRRFTLDELRGRIERGEIQDMKTVVGISLL